MSPSIGDVVVVNFPSHNPRMHEQEGRRPAVVVGFPENLGSARYRVVLVIPLTSDKNYSWAMSSPKLYPHFSAGTGGLPRDSIVLLDNLRAVDTSRVTRKVGTLPKDKILMIKESLKKILELS